MPTAKKAVAAKAAPPQSRSFLRIEGVVAELVTEQIVKQMPVTELQQQLVDLLPKKGIDLETPALPRGTRFFVRKGAYDFFVLESEPRKRVMVTGPDEAAGWFHTQRTALYAMPYTIIVIQAVSGKTQVTPGFRVFFSKEPLRTLDDPMFIAPLPNLDNRGTICVGNTPAGKGNHVVEAIEDVVANFWGSAFRYGGQSVVPNGAYPDNQRPNLFDNWGSHSDGRDFKQWAEDTKKNGDMYGLDYPWEPSKYTVRKAIENPEKGIGE